MRSILFRYRKRVRERERERERGYSIRTQDKTHTHALWELYKATRRKEAAAKLESERA